MAEPTVVNAPSQLWRVARSSDPLRMSEITDSDNVLATAGNRFDTPCGGVLYASTDPYTCYLETLARFRPSAKVRAVVRTADAGFMVCGGVPADWRARRVKVCLELVDPLPFLDVESASTQEFLTTELADELAELEVGVLDVAAVRGPNRLITRTIATWAFQAGMQQDDSGNLTVPDGFLYSGIRYLSRMGNHECWAIFQGAQVIEVSRHTISLSDPDLKAASDSFELRIF